MKCNKLNKLISVFLFLLVSAAFFESASAHYDSCLGACLSNHTDNSITPIDSTVKGKTQVNDAGTNAYRLQDVLYGPLVGMSSDYRFSSHIKSFDPINASKIELITFNSHRYSKSVSTSDNQSGLTIANAINYLVDWFFPPVAAAALPDPNQGPGGPILVIDSASATFGRFYAEILRAEGMNAFSVDDITNITAGILANYDVVILAPTPTLTSAQVTLFTDWVNAGGNLIAMRPDAQLAGLLGLTASPGTIANGYMLVKTTEIPGNGIVNQTMQYHDTADLYTLNGASDVAVLYSDAVTATTNPAVTLNNVGTNGGKAAAFTYDLATSVVYTRQGNPIWESMERDGFSPIRSDDKYFGNAAADPQLDWVDLSKVAIPQADEQQRLLVNLIIQMNLDKRPLPRFWYFPRGEKAVVVMTGDDHANNGTEGRFNQFISKSPPGCSLENWECVRGTSYMYHTTPIAPATAKAFTDIGFEIALHANTNCADYNPTSLEAFYSQQLAFMAANYPGVPSSATQRHHCIAWTDWVTGAKVQLNHGIRLDTSYYFWPPSWVVNTPGFMTGSGMGMRFADLDGTLIDVYQAATQMTDESGQQYPFTIDTLLDRALGDEGYYGAFVINAHTDRPIILEATSVVDSAQARSVPVITSVQLMNWLDGRNSSKFSSITWTGNTLSFTVTPGADSFGTPVNGLDGLIPLNTNAGVLDSLTLGGGAVPYTIDAIKGIDYARFSAAAGTYTATYAADTVPPTIVSTTPVNGSTNVDQQAPVYVVFDEAIDVTTVNSLTLELRDSSNALVNATVSYNPLTRKALISPASLLAGNAVYTATVKGGPSGPSIKDVSGNPLAASLSWSFTTANGPTCPCSGWNDSTIPSITSATDSNAIEVGVRFQTAYPGFINSIRFYKGTNNTGTHIANLWTNTGTLLATTTFTNETGSGWQQVDFPTPVPITENTVYVASYYAPNGGYAADSAFFAFVAHNAGPLTMLKDGVSGGNGVYKYGPSSAFPTFSFDSTNYWVDVVFTIDPGADTRAPQVSTTAPANNAVDVSPSSPVTVRFDEAIDEATITSSTIQLYDASNTLVPANVTYDPNINTATLTPNSSLAANTLHTAVVKSGVLGIKDLAGNELVADVTWTFTTSALPGCPCNAWSGADTPINSSVSDPNAVELGVKFRSDFDGYIKGIRFYKGANNTGTHIGNLWSSTGANLATATFTGETASGWQQVDFASPVPITANTVYVASYFAPNGNYAADSLYFKNNGVDNAPIHLLQEGVSGSNGVYVYGAGSNYPSLSFKSTNYWVDVEFITNTGADTTPPTVMQTTPVDTATGVAESIVVTAQFNEAIDAATLTAASFSLSDGTNPAVNATVTYDAPSNTATLTPAAPLTMATIYTVVINTSVKDVAGNSLAADYTWSFTTVGDTTCVTPVNAIVAENCLIGNPSTEWDIAGIGDASIQGFSTDISVNKGGTVSFKIDTNANAYSLDIYRMGYYGGMGARKVATVQPLAVLPQNQPACLNDAATGLVDCGNWQVSASWNVPLDAMSGIYFAKVIRADTNGASHIFFIVRDDASNSDMLFQTSDTTWQAYNTYGGNSFYTGSPAGRAYKLSYNRPFNTRSIDNGQDWVFNSEYPMVRWLEANGYDVTYTTGVDSDRQGNLVQNHKTFLSVGHDEYWSRTQRDNIEAARAAGVNLAFFSGNEVFWKTRWENSIDGNNTPYRTLVSYKETHANAVIDPANPTWTGTWRDPRFSPPADGGRPENELTGTIFTVNASANSTASILVPDDDGKMRFWRNTDIANLSPGTFATLPFGTLGYEWDEDLDNGFRPAGLIRMSTTTVNDVSLLQDYGSTYATGTATHRLTLYRHNSGALVFGAGTIQWPWGLDSNHDNGTAVADIRMQQATVNLFADMGVQPGTLQSGLLAATASSDVTAPGSTIDFPTPGATFTTADIVTITGTATDTGGGVAGGVEVSVDGGINWHPATGRGNWSYLWNVADIGSITILSRAVDDSGNIELPGAGVSVTVGAAVCPCSIWNDSIIPTVQATPDNQGVEVGVKFTTDNDGFITGIRFYKGTGNSGVHIGNLWDSAGNLLATATFSNETATGWQQVDFNSPVQVTANTVYVASYYAPNGNYPTDNAFFAGSDVQNGPLNALQEGVSGGNGVFTYSANTTFPSSSFQSTNYWVDVVFIYAQDTISPTVTTKTPADGAVNVAQGTAVTAVFSEDLAPGTVDSNSFTLSDGTNLVAATVTYDGPSKTATLTPSSPLTANTQYTATLTTGITDVAGNPLAAAVNWSFTIASGACPCSVWSGTDIPANPAENDNNAVEIGVKFTADVDGFITGVRFYKGATNTGVHVGNVWSSTGQLLATATFANETASGWQQVDFNTPVQVTANTVYVASYYAPNGNYANDSNFFAGTGISNAPLNLLQDGISGGNGVYKYSASSAFPTFTWKSTNYWVDVVFEMNSTPDTTPPTVTSKTPIDGATNVAQGTAVTAVFSEDLAPGTVNGSSFILSNGVNTVAATVTYDGPSKTATLTPGSPLTANTLYTATLNGITDVAGNPLAVPEVWSFTVGAGDIIAPTVTTKTPADGAIGVSQGTNVTAVFSEDLATGTVDGSSFTLSDGTNLVAATVTYDGPSKTATLTPGSLLTANTQYTATLTVGITDVAGNPLAAPEVWSFTIGAVDIIAPTVTTKTPADGATNVAQGTAVTAVFSEDLAPGTVDSNSFTLSDGTNLVAATVTYDGPSKTATLTPSSPLTANTQYTATLTTGITDVAGNPLAAAVNWSFTIASGACPCSVWSGTDIPANPAENDNNAVEIGVKFTADVDGFITGVRFYKGATNTGVHVGNVWSSTGQLLATATFANETASGWQQVDFNTPVQVTANTVYVASYYAPNGNYANDSNFFAGTGISNAPLNLLQDGISGGNGVYKYSASSAFPTFTWKSTNYWVDVVFEMNSTPDTTPPTVTSKTPIDGATNVAQGTAVTAVFSEDLAPGTVNGSSFTLSDGVDTVAATVTYDGPSKTATLTPGSPLTANTLYTATLTSITDVAGNPLAVPEVWSFTIVNVDNIAPTVTNKTPANGATNVAQNTAVTAVFSEDLAPGTVNGSSFTLSDGANTVAATVTYDGPSKTATLTPGSPLTASTLYTATLTVAITDVAGNPLAAPEVWSFTIGAGDIISPTVTNKAPADGATNVAQGTAVTAVFSEDLAPGTVDGSSFTLSDGTNTIAATVTYDGPSKTATLTPGSLLTANTLYTATLSVAITDVAGNPLAVPEVWSFTIGAGDIIAPTVTNKTPANGATNVAQSTSVTAVFSEDLAPGTVDGSSFTLSDGTNTIAATVTYDGPSKTAALTPGSPLTANALYTATLSVAITDVAGNSLAAPEVWSFTTATATGPVCPCSVWNDVDVPANPSEADNNAVELGVKFTANVDGFITGIRFYKGVNNTGVHVGNLWSSIGQLLKSATFTNETASGWQQVDFATPVQVFANTVYVVSYFAPNGNYANDNGFFATAGISNDPLNILQDGASGGNGVYKYSASSAFPTFTWQSTNYWVDVVFETNIP
jgi:N,N-dimethylformamidase beta subunit-like, C-terminal/Domain of unknown function (DUF4082)/Bacterial Ig-like domain/Bacterial Ig domain